MEDPLRRVNEWKRYVTEKICPMGWLIPQPSTTVRPPSTYKPTDWPYQDVHALCPPSCPPPPLPRHGPVQNTDQLDPTFGKTPARLLPRQNTKQIKPAEPPHQDKHVLLLPRRSRASKMARRRRENNKPPPSARRVPGSGLRNDSQTKPVTSNNTSHRPALLHRLVQGAKSPDEPPRHPTKIQDFLPPHASTHLGKFPPWQIPVGNPPNKDLTMDLKGIRLLVSAVSLIDRNPTRIHRINNSKHLLDKPPFENYTIMTNTSPPPTEARDATTTNVVAERSGPPPMDENQNGTTDTIPPLPLPLSQITRHSPP